MTTLFSPSSKGGQHQPPGNPATSPGAGAAPVLSGPAGYWVQGIAFSPDGKTIAASLVGGGPGQVSIWASAGHRLTASYSAPYVTSGIGGVAFDPKNANSLAVADVDWIDLFDLAARDDRTYDDPGAGYPAAVAYAPDGKTIADFNGAGAVYLLNAANGQLSAPLFTDPQVSSSGPAPLQVTFSPDGKTLAAADSSGNVFVWGLPGGLIKRMHAGYPTRLGSSEQVVSFSPDGKTLAVADGNSVKLFNAATGLSTGVLPGAGRPVQAVAFSPDGATLAIALGNGRIALEDVASRHSVSFPAAVANCAGLAFSPGGATLAAFGDHGNRVYLYSTGPAGSLLPGRTRQASIWPSAMRKS